MKTLTLRGEELGCIDVMPPGLLFDLSDIDFETKDPQAAMRNMSALGKWLREIVLDEEQERFRQILYDKKNPISMDDLSDAATKLLMEYAGRPTERPSNSPAGGEASGQPSRVVSLQRATVETVDPSSKVGASSAS